jgi:hypothetical protein
MNCIGRYRRNALGFGTTAWLSATWQILVPTLHLFFRIAYRSMEPWTAYYIDTAFWTLGIVVSYACFTIWLSMQDLPSIAKPPRNVKFYVSKPHKLEPRRPNINQNENEGLKPKKQDPHGTETGVSTCDPVNQQADFRIQKPVRIRKAYEKGKWAAVARAREEEVLSAGVRTAWSTAPMVNWPASSLRSQLSVQSAEESSFISATVQLSNNSTPKLHGARRIMGVVAEVHSEMDGFPPVE